MLSANSRLHRAKSAMDKKRWERQVHLYGEGAFRHAGLASKGSKKLSGEGSYGHAGSASKDSKKGGHCKCCGKMGKRVVVGEKKKKK
jgi:hypothetical protein